MVPVEGTKSARAIGLVGGLLLFLLGYCSPLVQLKTLAHVDLSDKFGHGDSASQCLVVGVLSASRNRAARDAIRATWGTEQDVCRLHFFIALPNDWSVLKQVQLEATKHKDIVLLNIMEHYRNITHQTLEIFKLAAADPAVTHVLKVDDDSYVRVKNLKAVLNEVQLQFAQQSFYLGFMESKAGPIRDRNSKWYMSPDVWPSNLYPRWAHGAGYLVSVDVARGIAAGAAYLSLRGTIPDLEDVSVGIWVDYLVQQLKRKIVVLHNPRFTFTGMCQDTDVVTHYVRPEKHRCLWLNNGQCAGCMA